MVRDNQYGGGDDPVEALKAIRKWVKESDADNDASDTAVLMCPACGHVRSVFETKDGEVECVKCSRTFAVAF